MIEIKILTQTNKHKLFELINVIEDNLDNKEWWLPISQHEKDIYFNAYTNFNNCAGNRQYSIQCIYARTGGITNRNRNIV